MKTVEDLVLTYYSSNDFSMLRDKSKKDYKYCLLYTSPSPRDGLLSRMPSSA